MIPQSPIAPESPIPRRAACLDFSTMGGKRQRHGRALIGAGVAVDACATSCDGGI